MLPADSKALARLAVPLRLALLGPLRFVLLGLAVLGLMLLGSLAGGSDEAVSEPPGELVFEPLVRFESASPGQPTVAGAIEPGPTGGDADVEGVIVGHVRWPSITARRSPSIRSEVVAELANPTEVGGPLVFQLVETEPDGVEVDGWVEVHLPIRPNGSTGWVPRAALELSRNPYRIEIDAGEHRLAVYRGGERWLETSVAIGTGATPTPLGRFYIIELLRPPDPEGLYGPYAFGLSGFSETLTSFAGGDAVIGIHGTNDPAALGTDVSHGCVRVANDVISEMAEIIPLGTPVIITA